MGAGAYARRLRLGRENIVHDNGGEGIDVYGGIEKARQTVLRRNNAIFSQQVPLIL